MLPLLAVLLLAPPMTAGPAVAVQPDEILDDPELEARARHISKDLRCLVCQNQSIDDSNAELARDLRLIVRERLVVGDSDTEVIDFVTARYGDYVLLRPPMKSSTWLLWYGPFAVVAIAGVGVAVWMRRRIRHGSDLPGGALSKAEAARLEALLGQDETGSASGKERRT